MAASSKTRPRDWHPLAESDPVPGDPDEIRDEVKHMTGVATSLREQARMLRGIGDDNELKGKYAEKLRDESGTLEKHLREVAGRYERVHGHLTNWANDLEDFQTQADDVLRKAKQKQDEVDAEKAKKESGDGKRPRLPKTAPRAIRCATSATGSTASRATATTARATMRRRSATSSTTSSRTAGGTTSRAGCTRTPTGSRSSSTSWAGSRRS